MSIDLDLAERLEKNSRTSYIGGVTIFLRLLTNIIENPTEEKYRQFKKTNPKISSELLSVDGMEELILDVGFEADREEFVLRRGGLSVVSKLKRYREFFQKRLEVVKSKSDAIPSPSVSSKGVIKRPEKSRAPTRPKVVASQPFHDRIKFPKVLQSQNNFIREIEQLSDLVMQYEDELLQQSALQLIPLEKLKEKALEKMRRIQKLIKSGETLEEPLLDDLILEELAEWFKTDFFTWINAMPCRMCKNEGTDAVGTRLENGVRVERYSCSKCKTFSEFPRYNDIEKLLLTRSGRCGEFANCFTFLCRCLGYDARYVYSTSDHVWTEVYNHSKKRWIHVDPSENVFDSPLMYEHGWKRKIDYVLVFSKDDVQDVTWRYSNQHKELTKRRNRCGEKELIDALLLLRNKRQSNTSAARKKFLTLRTLSELSELLIVRDPTDNELKGRSSGSLSWRLERGEAKVATFYMFTLAEDEKRAKTFKIRYSCAKNSFERLLSSSVIDKSSDWKNWTYQSENIFRKVEHDHKMAYLSRTEDSTTGLLQFKFDFGVEKVKSIDVTIETKTFASGIARVEFLDVSDRVIQKNEIVGASKFSIRLQLEGGDGDCAWQHAQVFRQPLSCSDFPFQVEIKFQ